MMKDSISINNFDFAQLKQRQSQLLALSKKQQAAKIRLSPVKNLMGNMGKVAKVIIANNINNNNKEKQKERQKQIQKDFKDVRNSQQIFGSFSINKVKPLIRATQTISSNQNLCIKKPIFKDAFINRREKWYQIVSQSQINMFPKKRLVRYIQKKSLNLNSNQTSFSKDIQNDSQRVKKQLFDQQQDEKIDNDNNKNNNDNNKINDYFDEINCLSKLKFKSKNFEEQNQSSLQKKIGYTQKLQTCIMSTSLISYKDVVIQRPSKKLNRVQSIQINQKIKKPITLPKLKTEGQDQAKSPTKKDRVLVSCLHKDFDVIKAQSYIVYQKQSKQVVVGDKYKNSLQIASLTKIMTFYVIIKIAKNLNLDLKSQEITVDDDIQGFPGTSADLYHGQKYTVQNMLYGLMLPSGNDAAMCLARWGGDQLKKDLKNSSKIKFFIQEMNKCAKQLELQNTKFGNPHGLPHIDSSSTVYDVAKLCSICLQNQLFKQIVKTRHYKCKIQNIKTKRKFLKVWQNTNKLLRRKNFIGIKTGITVTAGPCLASAYIFRQKTYIVVIAKCNKVSRRFKQTRYLLSICLKHIYQNQLTQSQQKTLRILYKANVDIDSDYSQQQRQFNYKITNKAQFKRRASIICNQI